jgi:hypothetical protein
VDSDPAGWSNPRTLEFEPEINRDSSQTQIKEHNERKILKTSWQRRKLVLKFPDLTIGRDLNSRNFSSY